ncbi:MULTISPECIES: DUF6037 family protein [Bacillus cereus group]|uniref:DUF6037 family protein n=1 Tax=Bacillus cereus group TaxID=86661 RepID=UPI000ABEE8B5|nr:MULTISPECIES: DUF6037 family protein [Bacillus cereus group]MCE9758263.1 DUF6037 family protein [Bacillus cereus]
MVASFSENDKDKDKDALDKIYCNNVKRNPEKPISRYIECSLYNDIKARILCPTLYEELKMRYM